MERKNESGVLEVTRIVNAPRELVWEVYSSEEHMAKWWGPSGFTFLKSKLDFREGGMFHYGMKSPDGSEMWGKLVYTRITKPSHLDFIVSFSDKDGGITRHPMAPSWPAETLSQTEFIEQNGKTKIVLRWKAINATPEECALFDASHDSMNGGLEGTFKQLEAYLGNIQK